MGKDDGALLRRIVELEEQAAEFKHNSGAFPEVGLVAYMRQMRDEYEAELAKLRQRVAELEAELEEAYERGESDGEYNASIRQMLGRDRGNQ